MNTYPDSNDFPGTGIYCDNNLLKSEYIYDFIHFDNAIDGNAISRIELPLVLSDSIAIGGKKLTDHLELLNYEKVISWFFEYAGHDVRELTEQDIIKINKIALSGIDDEAAGSYYDITAQSDMREFMMWFHRSKDDPIEFAVEAHYRMIVMAPFKKANGRTARLLMNLILMMHNLPLAIINKDLSSSYLKTITAKEPSKENMLKCLAIIKKAIKYSKDLLDNDTSDKDNIIKNTNDNDKNSTILLKIGQIAKLADESVSAVRFWTNEGLLEPTKVTESGYQLYDRITTLDRIRKIKALKSNRYTIEEIKEIIKKK